MRILFIGDPHLKISRLDQCRQFLRWIDLTIEKEKPDLIVNLGDTFDTHAVLRSEILCEFIDHVQRNRDFEYIYLLGNHDMFKPDDSTYHAMLPFKGIVDNLRVVDKITDIHDITFVPYMHNWQEFPKNTKPICVAHQTFVGADYGYYRPDVGVDADKISAEIIISGHVHKRQTFGKVYYPGTPFAQGLDDINQVKGVDIFDTTTYGFKFIESPFPQWKGIRMTIDAENGLDSVHQYLEDTLNTKDHWIVEMTGPKAEIVAYMDSKRWLKLHDLYSVRIRPEYNDKSKVSNKKIRSITMGDIVSEFVDKIYKGSIDKEVIKTSALQIIDITRKSHV